MTINTLMQPELAKPSLIIRALLLFFGWKTIFRFGMPVNTILLLVANPILLDELTYWHFV
jgi:hypothetical protein